MEVCVGVKRFSGIAEQKRVRAGNQVAEGVVNEVGGGGAEDVANRAEVVGEGPEDVGGRGVGNEFVLRVWRPAAAVSALKNTQFPRLRPNTPHVPAFVRPRAGKYLATVGVVCGGTRHRNVNLLWDGVWMFSV